jgi:hypothetical protein
MTRRISKLSEYATECYDNFVRRFKAYVNKECHKWKEPRFVSDVTQEIILGLDDGSGKTPFHTNRARMRYPSQWSDKPLQDLWEYIDLHPKLKVSNTQRKLFVETCKKERVDHCKAFNKKAVHSRREGGTKSHERCSEDPTFKDDSEERRVEHQPFYEDFLRRLNALVATDLNANKVESEIDLSKHFYDALYESGMYVNYERMFKEPKAYIMRPPKWMEEVYQEIVPQVYQVLTIKHLKPIRINDQKNAELRRLRQQVEEQAQMIEDAILQIAQIQSKRRPRREISEEEVDLEAAGKIVRRHRINSIQALLNRKKGKPRSLKELIQHNRRDFLTKVEMANAVKPNPQPGSAAYIVTGKSSRPVIIDREEQRAIDQFLKDEQDPEKIMQRQMEREIRRLEDPEYHYQQMIARQENERDRFLGRHH